MFVNLNFSYLNKGFFILSNNIKNKDIFFMKYIIFKKNNFFFFKKKLFYFFFRLFLNCFISLLNNYKSIIIVETLDDFFLKSFIYYITKKYNIFNFLSFCINNWSFGLTTNPVKRINFSGKRKNFFIEKEKKKKRKKKILKKKIILSHKVFDAIFLLNSYNNVYVKKNFIYLSILNESIKKKKSLLGLLIAIIRFFFLIIM